MVALIIDDTDRDRIRRLRAFAEERRNWIDCAKVAAGRAKPAGVRKSYVIRLSSGRPEISWRVVYSIDLDGELGAVRHLSVTIKGAPGRGANESAMTMIAEEFGIEPPFDYIGPHPARADPAVHLMKAHDRAAGLKIVEACGK